MAPTVNGVYTGSMVTTANPTVSLGATPVSGDVLILCENRGLSSDPWPSAVSGAGATWTKIEGSIQYMTFWMGTGATSSGTITATAAASTSGRCLRLYHLSGVQAHARYQQYISNLPLRCTENQIIIGTGFSQSSAPGSSITSTTPAFGWTNSTETVMVSAGRRFNTTHLIPHMATDCHVDASAYSAMLVVGSPVPGTTVVRENLVYNSSMETNTYGWNELGFASIAVSADTCVAGTKSLKGTANAAAPEVFMAYTTDNDWVPVGPGKTYTASGYVYSVSDARTAAMTLRWLDEGGTVRQTDTATPVVLTANTWTRLTYTATVPVLSPLVVFAAIGIKITTGISGDICYFDAFLWEEGSSASTYWDGLSGDNYLFTAYSTGFQSMEITAAPARVPAVHAITTSALTTAANPTVTLADTPAAGDVLVLFSATGATTDAAVSAVSGCGATWTQVPGGQNYMRFWIGTGATSSGTVTATATSTTSGRSIRLFHLKNVRPEFFTQQHDATFPIRASTSQIVIGAGYGQINTAGASIVTKTPPTGWTTQTEVVHTATDRRSNTAYSVPVYNQGHNLAGAYGLLLVVGSPAAGMKVVAHNPVSNSNLDRTTTTYTQSATVGTQTISSAVAPAFGIASYRAPTTGANAEVYKINSSPMVPVMAGSTYTVSAYVYTPGSRTAALTVRWYTSSGGSISTSTSTATTPTGSTWTRLTYTVTAPATACFGAMGVKFADSVNLDVFYTDAWMFNEGSAATDYFDGLTTPPAGHTNMFLGQSDLYPSVQMAPTLEFNSREGGAWVDRSAVPKVWNGTAWVVEHPKYWDGSAWVALT